MILRQPPTKSTPSIYEVITKLLQGKPLHHQDVIKAHGGTQHRLGITIHKLRHRFGFKDLIHCPRSNHPYKNHYFILQSDLEKARQLAIECGLIREV